MIQIQDDNFNQSASAPTSNQTTQNTQPITTAPKSDSSKDNSSEIDKLLAELDQLSKNLDEKPAVSAPLKENVAEEKPAISAESPKEDKAPITDEKFDFDAFLSDLEKKIDQENDKQQDDDSSTDFRKNRLATDPQLEHVDEPEETSEKAPDGEPQNNLLEKTDSEELKAQNIFDMLGLMNIEDEEKNQFLDELEAMIWDDFVTHDLELLLTSEEYAGAREILDTKVQSEAQQKENLIVYLEKLVPDLDEVLYDKALELKSEMMGERLAKMKESADGTTLAKIKEVEGLISQNHWKSAVSLLNQLS